MAQSFDLRVPVCGVGVGNVLMCVVEQIIFEYLSLHISLSAAPDRQNIVGIALYPLVPIIIGCCMRGCCCIVGIMGTIGCVGVTMGCVAYGCGCMAAMASG